MTPEFSRSVRADAVSVERYEAVVADAAERAALAARFGLDSLDRLEGRWTLAPHAEGVLATGRILAAGAQACVTTAEPVPFALDAPATLLFTRDPLPELTDEAFERELEGPDLVEMENGALDLGEATAQSMALELDPWPRAPDADERRRALGIATEVEASPFAKLLGLKRD